MARPQDVLKMLGTKSKVVKPQKAVAKVHQKLAREGPTAMFDAWTVVGSHLAYRTPKTPPKIASRVKVAAFDMDGTLIKTRSGSRFSMGPHDWRWFSEEATLARLSDYQEDGYVIVIFTNQAGIVARQEMKSFQNFVLKVDSVLKDLNDVFVFASPKRPAASSSVKAQVSAVSTPEQHENYRKPSAGMWDEFTALIRGLNQEAQIDLDESFYCGDAAGRPGDFSDSDKKFAQNVGLKFHTPEELFK